MGKSLEDVAKSRDARVQVKEMFGGIVPESILKYNSSDQSIDLLIEEGGRAYDQTGWVARHPECKNPDLFVLNSMSVRAGALSRFPQNVGRILLRIYTEAGDTVVDPFAGHNSRMQLCWSERRNYIGCDLSKEFMAANFKLKDQLLDDWQNNTMFPELNTATIELHECDSKKMPVKNGAGDFTITSPPYWCLEHYGDEFGQLGKCSEYAQFLRELGQIACENFRCLKAGSFCVWFVNDFRLNCKFYSYHMHTAQLLRDAGFQQWDIAIVDLGVAMRAAFATQVKLDQILPKRHEYALIFRKP